MGKRGPKPLPTHLKVLRGTDRADRRPKREPKPRSGPRAPTPPSFLGKLAREEWRRVVPELHRLGILTAVDRAAIAAYCQSYARWIEAEAVVTEQGSTFMTEKGYVCQRPEVTIAQKERTLMRQFAAEFGLTPSSRTRIEVPAPKEKDDPDEAFLFGQRKKKGAAS